MIAGLSGDLISQSYVEQRVLPGVDRGQLAGLERNLVRWWNGVSRTIGPASSARAIHDQASTPLLLLLDHERPSAIPETSGLSALLPEADAVLLTVPWTASTSSVWRDALCRGAVSRASWALITNGRSLRIVDCTRAWSRAAIEFDFERLTSSPKGIAALWALARSAALGGSGDRSLRALLSASDAHGTQVCRSLSDGVLAALARLCDALASHRRAGGRRDLALDQALTIVYRILFLLFAEARSLVPVWSAVYRDAYTIDALTDRAMRSVPAGLWEALQAISRMAHSGCEAGDLAVTAFNGRLFSPRHTPLAEHRHLPDAVIQEVLLSLATETSQGGRRRISYHDLGVEQLGSVYERVLEYQPAPTRGSALERTSTRRKTSGSFYTPTALTEFLVRRTLAPLVDGRSAEEILNLRVVDPSMGSGAFLVAACGYLADACEQAMVRDSAWPGTDEMRSRAALRRTVAERCLYGVDLNPTAVQLARLSLWLTTLASDCPLTFLDHHLAAGNSLIGAWLGDLARPQASAARRAVALPLFDDVIAHDVSINVLPERLRMALSPSDTVEAVRSKERSLMALTRDGGPLSRWKAAADAWCAASLWHGARPSSGVVAEWIEAAVGGPTTLPAGPLKASLDRARSIAASHSAFHWELEFPEAFFDLNGRPSARAGFDAVIGNPPWDVLRADTGSTPERERSRAATTSALRFYRHGYAHQGSGHTNCYQLFVERALRLTRPGGRVGLLLPSGVSTDHGSASLRRHLLDHTTIDTWIGFDNRRRIFPIHRSVRFVLMSATNAGTTETLRFRCGVTDPTSLQANHHEDASLMLSRERIAALSPEHLTIPEIPDARALRILTTIGDRVPALGDAAGWHARFGRELNATDDRAHFVPRDSRHRAVLPIIEGKLLSPFQVDLTRSRFGIPSKAAAQLLNASTTFRRSRIGYRDVASATNKLTLIAAMLPSGTVSTHTVFCLKTPLGDDERWCLLGLMNSLVANYLVRLQVTTHVTTALMSRLPVPKPVGDSVTRIAALARRLAASGIEQNVDDYATLNAVAARLYGISKDDYHVVLESFPLLPERLRQSCAGQY